MAVLHRIAAATRARRLVVGSALASQLSATDTEDIDNKRPAPDDGAEVQTNAAADVARSLCGVRGAQTQRLQWISFERDGRPQTPVTEEPEAWPERWSDEEYVAATTDRSRWLARKCVAPAQGTA